MKNIWFYSDTHFGHHNAYRFIDDWGELIRPWADNADDGDELMIEAWNSVVKPGDRVYHLGDVAIRRRDIKKMGRLQGRKVLVRGNHDRYRLRDYTHYFDDVRGSHKLERIILSHYPIHTASFPEWCVANIHGHTHSNVIKDCRYLNVCVEQLEGLRPIHRDEVLQRIGVTDEAMRRQNFKDSKCEVSEAER